MVFNRVVANDVVIDEGVTLWSEVPWLLLWIIRSFLKSSQLILEIQYIVCLLITKGTVLILSQHVDEFLLFLLSAFALDSSIGIFLGNRVVTGLLGFDGLVGYLNISWCLPLEFSLLIYIFVYI